MFAEGAVDARVELALMVGVVGCARVVVGGSSEIGGSGETRQQRACGGIELRVNCVVRKFLPHVNAAYHRSGSRIEDFRNAGENALALIQCGNC